MIFADTYFSYKIFWEFFLSFGYCESYTIICINSEVLKIKCDLTYKG